MSTPSSLSGPLRIDAASTPGGGTIGMVHCPGRCTAPWRRDLVADLAAIVAWRADALVSLVEQHEFARLGVPEFAEAVRQSGLQWLHMPIRDMEAPGGAFATTWAASGPELLRTLGSGGRIVLHCAAGLGRTGTMAAKILVALGATPDAAIADVRRARAGTIETAAQEDFVRCGPSLAIMRRQP